MIDCERKNPRDERIKELEKDISDLQRLGRDTGLLEIQVGLLIEERRAENGYV